MLQESIDDDHHTGHYAMEGFQKRLRNMAAVRSPDSDSNYTSLSGSWNDSAQLCLKQWMCRIALLCILSHSILHVFAKNKKKGISRSRVTELLYSTD